MKEDEIKLFVLNYLKKKGYTHSVNSFEEEAAVASLPNLAQKIQQDEAASVTNYILFHDAKKESTPEDYNISYTALKEWVYKSLNSNRGELITVLFPIFVHCYLDLIAKGFYDACRLFIIIFLTELHF